MGPGAVKRMTVDVMAHAIMSAAMITDKWAGQCLNQHSNHDCWCPGSCHDIISHDLPIITILKPVHQIQLTSCVTLNCCLYSASLLPHGVRFVLNGFNVSWYAFSTQRVQCLMICSLYSMGLTMPHDMQFVLNRFNNASWFAVCTQWV